MKCCSQTMCAFLSQYSRAFRDGSLMRVETESRFLRTPYALLPWFCVQLHFYAYYAQKFALTRPLPHEMNTVTWWRALTNGSDVKHIFPRCRDNPNPTWWKILLLLGRPGIPARDRVVLFVSNQNCQNERGERSDRTQRLPWDHRRGLHEGGTHGRERLESSFSIDIALPSLSRPFQSRASDKWAVNTFTQFQLSPAASPGILHHTIRNSEERWLYEQILTASLIHCFLKGWEKVVFELGSERVKHSRFLGVEYQFSSVDDIAPLLKVRRSWKLTVVFRVVECRLAAVVGHRRARVHVQRSPCEPRTQDKHLKCKWIKSFFRVIC